MSRISLDRIPAKCKIKVNTQPAKVVSKVTKASKKREQKLSYIVGCGCVVGLFLSGIDSTLALHRFLQLPTVRAGMLAIVIDGLMVGAEICIIITHCGLARKYATCYLLGAGGLSVVLNAAEFASVTTGKYQVLNAIVGGLVPLLVLIGSKFSGYLYVSSQR